MVDTSTYIEQMTGVEIADRMANTLLNIEYPEEVTQNEISNIVFRICSDATIS